jgi:hypothetical protein
LGILKAGIGLAVVLGVVGLVALLGAWFLFLFKSVKEFRRHWITQGLRWGRRKNSTIHMLRNWKKLLEPERPVDQGVVGRTLQKCNHVKDFVIPSIRCSGPEARWYKLRIWTGGAGILGLSRIGVSS